MSWKNNFLFLWLLLLSFVVERVPSFRTTANYVSSSTFRLPKTRTATSAELLRTWKSNVAASLLPSTLSFHENNDNNIELEVTKKTVIEASGQKILSPLGLRQDLDFDDNDGVVEEDLLDLYEECILDFEDFDQNQCNGFTALEKAVIILDRENIKLGAWETYTLVSAFVATCSFTEILEFEQTSSSITQNMILLISSISAIFGVHATMVFSLSVLYGKASLGMKRDEIYNYFIESCTRERELGFQSFVTSLVTFSIQIVLTTQEKFISTIEQQLPFLAIGCAALAFCFNDWKEIIDKAAPIMKNDTTTNRKENISSVSSINEISSAPSQPKKIFGKLNMTTTNSDNAIRNNTSSSLASALSPAK